MNHVHAAMAVFRRVFAGTLSWDDGRLLFCVSALETIALAALERGSIRRARRVLAWLRPVAVTGGGRATEARIIWALAARARWLSSSTCLGRALVAELLIDAAGRPLTIVIGVAASDEGMRSHAWIERNGRVLLGGEDAKRRYVPLFAWSSAAR